MQERPKKKVKSSPDKLVDVIVTPSNDYLFKGISNTVQVLFEIKTGSLPTDNNSPKRMPLNMAIVLDRSGSMQGQKFKNAKLAIQRVIENLAIDDMLHLIVYGTTVEVIFENASLINKSTLLDQVASLKTSGCTNLWGGVAKGEELISKYHQTGYSPRLFLFSDGLVNEGIKDKAVIIAKTEELNKEKNLNVSAFGLGDDFDQELMQGIADKGKGAYFFIKGAEAIPQFVEFALSYILRTIGNNAMLKIGGDGEGILTKIYSDDKDSIVNGFSLGDLREENVRSVVTEFEVKVPNKTAVEAEKIGFYELSYTDQSEKKITVKGSIVLQLTNDTATFNSNKSSKVLIKVTLQKSGDLDSKLSDLMSKRQTQPAIQVQEEQVALLKSIVDIDEKEFNGANKVRGLLDQAEKGLAKLKQEGVTTEREKEVHHRQYAVRRG